MAENLRYADSTKTASLRGGKSHCAKDDCESAGRFYNWAAAVDSVEVYKKKQKSCGYKAETCCPSPRGVSAGRPCRLWLNEESCSMRLAVSKLLAKKMKLKAGLNVKSDRNRAMAMMSTVFPYSRRDIIRIMMSSIPLDIQVYPVPVQDAPAPVFGPRQITIRKAHTVSVSLIQRIMREKLITISPMVTQFAASWMLNKVII